MIRFTLNLFAVIQFIIFGCLSGKWYIQRFSAVFGKKHAEPWEIVVGIICLLTGIAILVFYRAYDMMYEKHQRVIKIVSYNGNSIDYVDSITRRDGIPLSSELHQQNMKILNNLLSIKPANNETIDFGDD
jgi:hypothetical protein